VKRDYFCAALDQRRGAELIKSYNKTGIVPSTKEVFLERRKRRWRVCWGRGNVEKGGRLSTKTFKREEKGEPEHDMLVSWPGELLGTGNRINLTRFLSTKFRPK